MKIKVAAFFFWSFLLLIIEIQSSFCAVITSPPQSVTVPLNEERVNFTCEGTGDALRWTVAGLNPTSPLNQGRDITVTSTSAVTGNLSSVLTIAVLPINDGVVISCFLYSDSNPYDPAVSTGTLTIRGISPVEDIQWLNETQTLSWSRPSFYSQDVIGYSQSDTNYNVLVDGISIINTTDTSVELSSSLVNVSCTNFTVNITASAYVYVSEQKQEVINNTGNYTVRIDNNSTSNFDRASCAFNVNLTINCTAPSCSNTLSGKLSPNGTIQQDKPIITDQEHGVFNYTFTGLEPCGHTYTAEIEIIDTLGARKDHDDIIITTPSTEVQDILVSSEGYTNGSVNVQCVFVSGSTADGCHVIFTDTTNGRNESFTITGSDETLVSLSTSGHYTVTVYDIFNGDIILWTCLQPKEITVTSTIYTSASSIPLFNSATILASFSVSSVSNVMISSTVTVGTSGGSTTGIIYVIVSGLIGACVLVLFVILTLCVIIGKRQIRKKRVVLNAEHATCHRTQADTNHYQVLIPGVTSNGSSEATPPNRENPYHVTGDEISAIRNARQDNSSATTTTTTTTIPSIEIQSHDNSAFPYLDNHETYMSSPIPASTLNTTSANHERNDTVTSAIVTVSSNSAAYAIVTINNNDTTAPVNPPTGVQPVMYSEVAGDVTKRGVVTVYSHDNNDTTTADLSTIGDVFITIDEEDTENNDSFEVPPPPYEATLSHPQEEIAQTYSTDTQFVPSVQARPVTDRPTYHNSVQYGIKSDTSGYEASPCINTPDPDKTSVNTSDSSKTSLEIQPDIERLVCLPTPPLPSLHVICSYGGSNSKRVDYVEFSGWLQSTEDDGDDEIVSAKYQCNYIDEQSGELVFQKMIVNASLVAAKEMNMEAFTCGREDNGLVFKKEEYGEMFAASREINNEESVNWKRNQKGSRMNGEEKSHEKMKGGSDDDVKKKKKNGNKKKKRNAFLMASLFAMILAMAKDNKSIAPKKVFKREKGSIKSSNGFRPQIIIDYLQTLLLTFSTPCWVSHALRDVYKAKPNNSAASRRDAFLKDEEYLGFERNKLITEAMLLSCHLLSLFVCCLFTAIIGVSYSYFINVIAIISNVLSNYVSVSLLSLTRSIFKCHNYLKLINSVQML